jgi:hypothetical protein
MRDVAVFSVESPVAGHMQPHVNQASSEIDAHGKRKR